MIPSFSKLGDYDFYIRSVTVDGEPVARCNTHVVHLSIECSVLVPENRRLHEFLFDIHRFRHHEVEAQIPALTPETNRRFLSFEE